MSSIRVACLWAVLICCGWLAHGAAAQEAERQYVGDSVSMSLRDADLVETLRTFARLGDFNLILHPGVRGKVNLEFKDVPWDQALEVILKVHGLGMEMTGGTLQVASPAALREMAQRELSQREPGNDSMLQRQALRGTLEHADVRLVAELLADPKLGLLSRYGEAEVRADTGELILHEMPARMVRLAKLVAALDVPEAATEDLESLTARAETLSSLWR